MLTTVLLCCQLLLQGGLASPQSPYRNCSVPGQQKGLAYGSSLHAGLFRYECSVDGQLKATGCVKDSGEWARFEDFFSDDMGFFERHNLSDDNNLKDFYYKGTCQMHAPGEVVLTATRYHQANNSYADLVCILPDLTGSRKQQQFVVQVRKDDEKWLGEDGFQRHCRTSGVVHTACSAELDNGQTWILPGQPDKKTVSSTHNLALRYACTEQFNDGTMGPLRLVKSCLVEDHVVKTPGCKVSLRSKTLKRPMVAICEKTAEGTNTTQSFVLYKFESILGKHQNLPECELLK